MVPTKEARGIALLRFGKRICIFLSKGKESFVFRYDDASCSEVLLAVGKWWANEELDFDGFDARQVWSFAEKEFRIWWPKFMLENQVANSLAKRTPKGERR